MVNLIMRICICIILLIHCKGLRPPQTLRKRPTSTYGRLQMGYLSPEKDPEFSKQSPAATLTELPLNSTLPVPKEGDIVRSSKTWAVGASKTWEDHRLGRIRFLRYDKDRDTWMADVSPLEEGKSEKVFNVDKNAKSFFEDVNSLKPVQAFFQRSENGYKVAYKKNSTEIILKAAAYREVDENYIPPRQKAVDLSALQTNLETYGDLKDRILKATFAFGAVGTVICLPLFGSDVAIPYASGVAAGGLYLFLLGKKIDGIGASYTLSNTSYSKIDSIASNLRLFVPVALMGGLALRNSMLSDVPLRGLSSLSREQFLGAATGFLTYRLAIFASEILTEVRTEDWLSIMPGSVAEMYRQTKSLTAKNQIAQAKSDAISTVILLTGPKAAGRSAVSPLLVARGIKSRKTKTLNAVKYLTTDTSAFQSQPGRYTLIDAEEMERLRGSGRLFYEFEERSSAGRSWTSALSTEQLASKTELGETFVVDGPPSLLDAISKVPNVRTINIWISLQTKEQFIAKATDIVKSELTVSSSQTPAESANRVSDLVNDAAKDITFYMQKAPLFDFTLLNSGTDEEIIDELTQLLSSAL